ncbi:hypothetical protein DPMN_003189 [Dreissena polymorpha]|uniref:Uncharacterized protein n=1 Tax=Dreissena polymorpha TaxID=45954 RepID=A0A9D4RRW8_DREPO|nr:hypothetical protein DPMN_003189 [Dreissena polymorpha]
MHPQPSVAPLTRHKHNPRLRHGQIISTRRPKRVFTRRIAVALGIDPRNDAESVLTSRSDGNKIESQWLKLLLIGLVAASLGLSAILLSQILRFFTCGDRCLSSARLTISLSTWQNSTAAII